MSDQKNLPVIFFIGGMGDIDVATNQSLKNTIKYLSQFGFHVHYFGAFPAHYHILQDPKKIFTDRVTFHRSPDFLAPLFDFLKVIKDTFGMARKKSSQDAQNLKATRKIRYYDEYNLLGRFFYAGFLFMYAPIEIIRVTYYYFKLKPSLFYGINGQGSVLATLFSRIFKKPVLQRWHGCSLTEEDLERIRTRLIDKLVLLDGGFAKWLPADAVVVTNDGSRGNIIFPLIGVPKDKLHFWMNGMDFEDMALPSNWDPAVFKASLGLEGKKVLLMVTRLVLWKRVDRGIDCVYRLVKEQGMKDIQMLILGDGPEAGILKAKAENLGIGNHIQWMGSVAHKEVAKYFSIANAFLSLCDMMNLVNPLLEAMYTGLPIFTPNDGSTSELLVNGENAFLIPHDRLEADLPIQIKAVLTDPVLWQKIGANAKRTFQQKVLSWEDRMRLEYDMICRLIFKTAGPTPISPQPAFAETA